MTTLREAPGYIWIFVIVGIMGGLGILILTEFQESLTSSVKTAVNNETITITDNNTIATFAHTNIPFGNYTGVTVTNETESDAIYSDNWIINDYGIFMGVNTTHAGSWDGVNINVTYTFEAYNTQGNVIQNSTLGVANVTKQLPTVGIVVGVSLIIGILVLLMIFIGRPRTY